jgi:probable O-glycosylation ligase (exosortase A-associated)
MTPNGASRPAHWPTVGGPAAVSVPAAAPAAAAPVPVRPGARSRLASVQAAAADAAESPFTTPFLIVLAYVFVDYGRPQDWLTPLQALRPGMLVYTAGFIALIKYKKIAVPPIAKYIFAFLALMAISVPIATNNGRAFSFTKDFALFMFGAVMPVMTFVESPKQTSIFFRYWIGINALLAFYGLTHGGRGVGSFLGDENDFCLAVNVALPYSFFLMSAAKSKTEKLLMLGCLALGLASVVTSLSRGGFLGLLAAAAAIWLRSPNKIRTLVIMLAAVAVLSLTVSDAYWKEMQTIQTADEEGDTGANRLYFWGIGWKMFLDNPIIGVGPANFQYNSFYYEDPEKAARGFHVWGKAAHSLYFTLLPEEGIVGVYIFTAIGIIGWRLRRQVGLSFRALQKTRPELITDQLKELYLLSRAIDVSLLAYLVTGAFISVLYFPHFWLIAAFSVVVRRAFDAELQRIAPVPAAPATSRWGTPRS